MPTVNKIYDDLGRLDDEIILAEKELNTAEAQKSLLQKQGVSLGVKNANDAKKMIQENEKTLQDYKGQIETKYVSLKSAYEW